MQHTLLTLAGVSITIRAGAVHVVARPCRVGRLAALDTVPVREFAHAAHIVLAGAAAVVVAVTPPVHAQARIGVTRVFHALVRALVVARAGRHAHAAVADIAFRRARIGVVARAILRVARAIIHAALVVVVSDDGAVGRVL